MAEIPQWGTPESTPKIPLRDLLQGRLKEIKSLKRGDYKTDFEYRICSQFLKLPNTMAMLEQRGIYGAVQKKYEGGIRRLFHSPDGFYKDLVLGAYHDSDVNTRLTLLGEVRDAFHKQSDELLQSNSFSSLDVTIVGAGGTGLTVARELIAKGVSSEKILVIEKRDYVGGIMADTDIMPFPLLKKGKIQGKDVLIQPSDLLPSFDSPMWRHHYKDAVSLTAFFSGVPVVLGNEVVESEDVTITSMDDLNKLIIRDIQKNSTKDIRTNAVVLALGKQAAYGDFTRDSIDRLGEDAAAHIYTAERFLKKLTEINSMTGSEEKEALRTLFHNRLALVGGRASANQIVRNVAQLLNRGDLEDILDTLGANKDKPLITVYCHKLMMQKIKDVLSEFELPSKYIDRIIGHMDERVISLSKEGYVLGINRAQNYGSVVFTGYLRESFIKLARGIRKGGKPVVSENLNDRRTFGEFNNGNVPKKTKIFIAGMAAKSAEPYIIDDGQHAVEIAEKVYRAIKQKK